MGYFDYLVYAPAVIAVVDAIVRYAADAGLSLTRVSKLLLVFFVTLGVVFGVRYYPDLPEWGRLVALSGGLALEFAGVVKISDYIAGKRK